MIGVPVCLDTTYLIDIVEAPERVRSATAIVESDPPLATTVMNVHEAHIGIYATKARKTRARVKERLERTLSRLSVLPFLEDDAKLSAKIGGQLRAEGVSVGPDAIVAAVAYNNGYRRIVTANVADFEAIAAIIPIEVVGY